MGTQRAVSAAPSPALAPGAAGGAGAAGAASELLGWLTAGLVTTAHPRGHLQPKTPERSALPKEADPPSTPLLEGPGLGRCPQRPHQPQLLLPLGRTHGQDSQGFPAPGERDGPLCPAPSASFVGKKKALGLQNQAQQTLSATGPALLDHRERDVTITNFSDSSEISAGRVPTSPGSNEPRSRRHPLRLPKRELVGNPTFALPCLRFLEWSVQWFFPSPRVS